MSWRSCTFREVALLSILTTLVVVTAGAVSCAEKTRALVVTAVDRAMTDDARKKALTERLCGARSVAACTARADDVWTDVRAFYQSRGGEPVWVSGRKPGKAATAALSAFRSRGGTLASTRRGTARRFSRRNRSGSPTCPPRARKRQRSSRTSKRT
jgi:hypothetical protein